jgi:hypothetical protein
VDRWAGLGEARISGLGIPSCSCPPPSTHKPTANRRQPTASSLCTSTASPAIDPDSGSGGFHGRSTPTTRPTSPHSARRRSGWSTAATHRPSGPMSRVMHVCPRWRMREARTAFLDDVRYRLHQAQESQKRAYDQHHRQVLYNVGDWALLRLRQRPSASLPRSPTGKLKSRYVGPYRVEEIINDAAVRLQLPSDARIHDVFHVGVLKKFVRAPPTEPPALPATLNGAAVSTPSRVLAGRLARGIKQVLVQWHDELVASATWEDFEDFRASFPAFQLEDELTFEDGRREIPAVTAARAGYSHDGG